MGLDVALGVIILIAAIRGWIQGFLHQFIRIGGLIACVYLADPVRDQAKPYIVRYLPAIPMDRMDQLLWWVSAGVTYVVLVGASTLALKMTRRPEIPGMPPLRSRNDQFAGFLLGIAKGGLVAAFLAAGLEKYGLKQIEMVSWAHEQARSSQALVWNGQYHPASRIWESVPVRHFVNHIQRMGLQGSASSLPTDAKENAEDRPVVQTARRGSAEGPGKAARGRESESSPPVTPAPPSVRATSTDPEVEQAIDEIKAALDAAAEPR